jgi:tRNA(Arg) A34 adenosine deaminase TadA
MQVDKDGDFFSLYRFELVRYYQADCDVGHFYTHQHPDSSFVKHLRASIILENETRSLLDLEYWVITTSGTRIQAVSSPEQLACILMGDLGLQVTDQECRRLYDGLVIPSPVSDMDLHLLRQAINLAASARAQGNHPFGALIADREGNVLAQAKNTVVTDSDVTGHAETNLIRIASRQVPTDVLAAATLYTSTEPCAMCSGAIYWSGISRVIYGMPEDGLASFTGSNPENPTLALPSKIVLNAGQRHIEVIGPLLMDEAVVVHAGFWDSA